MRLSMQSVRCVALLLLGHGALSVASTFAHELSLGALPVGEATAFEVDIPYDGDDLFVVELTSNCPCLEVGEFSETLTAAGYRVAFTFTPFADGPATVRMEFKVLDPASGDVRELLVPVSLIGFERQPRAGDLPGWFRSVTPAEVFGQMGGYRIIDLRGPEAFEKAHIPGSLEYSLDALIAQPHLISGKVLLVGDGLVGERESALLNELHSFADRIHWLEGGLPAWLRANHPAAGAWPAVTHTALVSLNRWVDAGGTAAERWTVVDLSASVPEWGRFFGLEVIRPRSGAAEALNQALLSAMEAALRLPDARGILVVGDAKELVYPRVEAIARQHQGLPVYYLKSGQHGYEQWLSFHSGHTVRETQRISFSGARQQSAPGATQAFQSSGRSGCASCPNIH